MARVPAVEEILEHYSFREILNLIEEKHLMDIESSVEHVRLNVMSYINDQFSRAQRPKTIKRVQFEETAQSDRPDDREKEISGKRAGQAVENSGK